MAKPRIFISSTFYDLKQIRSDLDSFIDVVGYESIRNEEGDIPYGKDEALEEYCYKEIKSVDILVSIIGGRFGSQSIRDNSSISQIELRTALKENKQVYIFIEKNVLGEYETYLLNKGKEISFRYVDDIRIYQFIEEIKNLNNNNNIKGFETASEISRYLKDQFAGLFQRFLEEQTRVKEVSLIKNLEKTVQTLNKIVTVLSDENKEKDEEINKILMINHPLVEEIRNYLDISYSFYIEGLNDLKNLLFARGFKYEEEAPWDEEQSNYYIFYKFNNRKRYTLEILKTVFDEDDKLKFYRKSDWLDEFVIFNEDDINEDDDDLPF